MRLASKLKNYLPVVITITIGLIAIGQAILSHQLTKHMWVEQNLLGTNLRNSSSNITIGHLWLEGYLAGDTTIDLAETFGLYEKALALLDEALTHEKVIAYPGLLKDIENLKAPLVEFHTLARKRASEIETSGSGTDIDQQFDDAFSKLQMLFEKTYRAVDAHKMDEERNSHMLHYSTVLSWFVIISITVFILYRYENRRQNAKEELKKSEERFRSLFETMAPGVVYQNVDGQIIFANPAAERIMGLSLEQMQGRTSIDPRWRAIHEDGSEFPGETHPSMVALHTGKEVNNVIMGIFNPQTDEYCWININAVPQFRSGVDGPYQVFTTFDDITEFKQVETDLHKHTLEQNILLKVSQSVANTLDLESELQTISDGVAQLLEIESVASYLLDEGELFLGATTPPLDPQMPEALRRAQLTDHPHILETVTTRLPVFIPDTKLAKLSPAEKKVVDIRHLRSLLYLPFQQEEDVIGVLILGTINKPRIFSDHEIGLCQTITNQLSVAIQNSRLHSGLQKYANELEGLITERKKAEEERERLATAINQTAEAIIISDVKGSIIYANPAFEQVTGYKPQEAIGKNPRILQSGQHDGAFYKNLWDTITSGKTWTGIITNKKKNGTIYEEKTTISPVIDEKGEIVSYVSVKSDITAERSLERAKTFFTNATSHELRTPLTQLKLLQMLSDDLAETYHDDEKVLKIQELTGKIYSNIYRIVSATSLLSDLMSEVEVPFYPITIKALLEYQIEIVQHEAMEEERNIRIHKELGDLSEKTSILGSQEMVEKAFSEILSNAIKYTPDGKNVSVKGIVANGEVIIEICNEGEGIPIENIESLFVPYYSIENVLEHTTGKYKHKGGGIGLGLTITKMIMEHHGGHITIKCDTESKGTNVALSFPKHLISLSN